MPESGAILVVGAGAVGTLVAGRIAAAGLDVAVAVRDELAAQALGGPNGLATLRVDDPYGRRTMGSVRVLHSGEETRARMLVLATKAQDAPRALRTWLAAVPADAPVIGLQNGLLADALQELAPQRYVHCTVGLPVTLAARGHAIQTGPGRLHLGPWPQARPRDDPKAFRAVAEVLAHAAPVRASANMRGIAWTKLAINNCITSLGAVTGQPLGELLRAPKARDVFLAIVGETYAVGRKQGVRFESVNGFRPALFATDWPGRRTLLGLVARRYRRHRSSSLQGLERGRATEVDFLNGHVVAAGARLGIPTPVNARIVELLHDIEQGRLEPAPHLLARLGV